MNSDGPSVADVANNFSVYVFWFLIALTAIFLALSIYSYVTAYGDPEVAKKGHHKLLAAGGTLVLAIVFRVLFSWF